MRCTVVPRKENPKKSVVYFVGVAYAGFAMENEKKKNEAPSIEGTAVRPAMRAIVQRRGAVQPRLQKGEVAI